MHHGIPWPYSKVPNKLNYGPLLTPLTPLTFTSLTFPTYTRIVINFLPQSVEIRRALQIIQVLPATEDGISRFPRAVAPMSSLIMEGQNEECLQQGYGED
jgi:hypothetical protein